ncbi:MAG: hypothetical protein J6A61_05815 [Clostridia bacterium]|nr:hypothetical protein [Clostridia bacterium]
MNYFEPKYKKGRDYTGKTTLRQFWKQMAANFEDMADGVAGWTKKHIDAAELDHADGSVTKRKLASEVLDMLGSSSVSPEQIQEAVEEYLTNNPIIEEIEEEEIDRVFNFGIYKIAIRRSIGSSILNYGPELLFVTYDGLVSNSGDGIQIRITGTGVLYRNKAPGVPGEPRVWESEWKEYGGSVDLSNYYTKDETKELVNSSVTKETILYEDVVNPPEWTNQPTYEGTLDSAFNTTDFYYVTLKDASGNTLPSGQFMLKDSRGTNATIYSTVFSFSVPASGVLVENFPVEFTEIGETVKMRDAGVWRIAYTPETWNLKGSTGSMKIKVIGEFVQREDNAYFLPVFGTRQNVSNYHSGHKTAMQSASAKQIIPFASLSANYKTNRFYEESVLERNGDKNFTFKRRGFLRYIKDGDTTYSIIDYDTVGYGDILTETELSSVAIQTASKETRGMIRNGTIIRVSEVV